MDAKKSPEDKIYAAIKKSMDIMKTTTGRNLIPKIEILTKALEIICQKNNVDSEKYFSNLEKLATNDVLGEEINMNRLMILSHVLTKRPQGVRTL